MEFKRTRYTLEQKKRMILEEFNDLCKEWSLDWMFEWSNTKSKLGQCLLSEKVIKISLPFLKVNELEFLIDTVRHEIAHAIDLEYNGIDSVLENKPHGPKWKKLAKEVGANPKSCADGHTVKRPPGKYAVVCDKCKDVISYRSRPIKPNRKYTHKRCGGRVHTQLNQNYEG